MRLSLWCCLPSLLAVPAPTAPGTTLAYVPKAGTRVLRTYTNPGERTLSSMRLVFGGDEHPVGKTEITERTQAKVVFEDELVEADGDRVTKLRRSFGEMSRSTTEEVSVEGKEDEEHTFERKSGLADATVVFTWDADEREYDAAFDGSGGDDALLADLTADVELSAFLPPKAVSEGDRWDVDVDAFRTLIQPGGDLGFEGETPEPEWQKKAKKDLIESFRGEIHARFEGTREVDGVQVGVIAIEAELSGEAEAGPDPERRGSQGAEVRVKEKLHGELLWDLEAQRAHSYELEGSGQFTLKMKLAFEMGDQKVEGTQELVFDVAETYGASFELRR